MAEDCTPGVVLGKWIGDGTAPVEEQQETQEKHQAVRVFMEDLQETVEKLVGDAGFLLCMRTDLSGPRHMATRRRKAWME